MGDVYTKDTVDAKLDAIHDDVKDVKAEAQKTNGRVRLLEKMMWMTIGAVGIIAWIIGQTVDLKAIL